MKRTKKVFWLAGMGLGLWLLIQYGVTVSTFQIVQHRMTHQMEMLINEIHQALPR